MFDPDSASASRSRRVQGMAVEMVCLLALWMLLTRGDSSGLLFGLCIAAIATGFRNGPLSGPPLALRPLTLARFLPGFIGQSLQAGADIALRAIPPATDADADAVGFPQRWRFTIEPRLHRYGLQLPPGNARTFFIGVISLLPGTLSAEVEGDTLAVHVIGGRRDVGAQLSRLEQRVASLFGLDPPSRNGAGPKERIRGSDHG
jgi:multicomponent Na+:H+ antiporter subunit E